MILDRGRRWAVLCTLALLLGPSGCGYRGDEQFIPPTATARQAVETVLTNVERGQPADAGTTAPVIYLVDSQLSKPGQKLVRHEIVKEESQDGRTVFEVRLFLKGAKREQVARYVVIGRDPLRVYREEDDRSAGGM
jgi:hypothetical protein